ncbi:pseudouridine synthase [candidate division KSB1 bacterium]|nr:pseudouridine synthase [candidate division KSB1 bacterium]
MIRINRYISMSGVTSRRKAEELIVAGRVSVNGRRISDLATQVDPQKDVVRIDQKRIEPESKKEYVLLNKPKGVVTTTRDERGRKTVMDLVKSKSSIFPVGRLDLNSEGLLLLTNDGELAHRLMHPGYKITKVYRVMLDKSFKEADFEPLSRGVKLDDGVTAPCKVRYYTSQLSRVEIIIHQGRNRQVRRMFEALGYRVRSLKRVEYGPLMLRGLDRGKYRRLNPLEIMLLKKAVNLR